MADIDDLFWITDAYGTPTACRNGKNLTLKEATIGNLSLRVDGWYVVMGVETLGPYRTMNRAKVALRDKYRGG